LGEIITNKRYLDENNSKVKELRMVVLIFFDQKFGSKPVTPIFALPKREKLSPPGQKR
jgi:hypothetical protein